MTREVEELWELLRRPVGVTRVGEATSRVTKLVKEWVAHCLDSRQTLSRRIFEQSGDQLDCVRRCLAEDLIPGSADLPLLEYGTYFCPLALLKTLG
jgi:hypothetical protein